MLNYSIAELRENKTCDKYFRIFAIGDTEKRHSSLGTMLKHCLWRFFSTVRVTAT